MDVVVYAALAAAIVAVVVGVRWWRAQRERERLATIRRLQDAVTEDEAFLDSSHISGPIPGLQELTGDPAERAAAAMRRADPPAR
ncbi:MAG: hypothetical protein U1F10_09655 [Burkholderiales bacterium]